VNATGHAHFLSIRELAVMLVLMRKVGIADRALVIRLLRGAMMKHPEYPGRKGRDASGDSRSVNFASHNCPLPGFQ
jgi:hypothetical protein